ncbi:hypothetical protein AYO20_08601 [Fonsecaea nubica]|uniref:Uncharacterized protein n=1 Tax=Fonsecaea nubica TaxID=856822 RepID=A0A178CL57_9EURO|nr:hypothetical protein AYO20_08601 [Fonsecaea nubica]OAL30639.1 hypothetical protein AYO20_08601 [Fonsecaea nubica]
MAVTAGDSEIIKSVLTLVGEHKSNSEKFTSVAIAARFGLRSVLKHLPRISNPNRLGADGKTPLCRATTPFEKQDNDTSALNVAVRSNQAQIPKLFLDLGEGAASNGWATKIRETHGVSECDTELDAHEHDPVHSRDLEMRGGLLLAAEKGFSAIALLMIQNMDVIDLVDNRQNTILHLAAKGGTHEVWKAVLEYGKIHVDVSNDNRRTALPEAAQRGFADCVSELLMHDANHLARLDPFTSIELVVMGNQKEATKALLEKQHDKDALGEALERAAIDDRTDLVTLLLDEGADVDYVDGVGDTFLHLAAYLGRERVVEILLRRRVDLELKGMKKWTALAMATIQKKASVMKLLLDAGGDPNSKDQHDMTPLNLAIAKAHAQNAALLLPRGAKINTCSLLAMNTESIQDSGLNLSAALNRAVQKKDLDMISLLLDHEADPEDTNVSDLEDPVLEIGSPLHYVAFHCLHEVAELLLAHEKRKVNPEDQLKMVKFLVRTGGNPTFPGGSYGNLLNCAVANACASILEDIMAVCDYKGISVKNADVEGKLASHFAATGPNQRAFELVLLPNLGAKDKQGRVPIHFAAAAGSLPALRFLLGHSVNLIQVDKETGTPCTGPAGNGMRKLFAAFLKRVASLSSTTRPLRATRLKILQFRTKKHTFPLPEPIMMTWALLMLTKMSYRG